jgi:hypothetical protein
LIGLLENGRKWFKLGSWEARGPRGRGREASVLSFNVIVPSKSVKKMILGFEPSVSGKGMVRMFLR